MPAVLDRYGGVVWKYCKGICGVYILIVSILSVVLFMRFWKKIRSLKLLLVFGLTMDCEGLNAPLEECLPEDKVQW